MPQAGADRAESRVAAMRGAMFGTTMMAGLLAGAILAATLAAVGQPAAAQERGWGDFRTPAAGTPQAIGSYANGCLAGGAALPPEGEGYQHIRLSRHRSFGHPVLIAFVQDFGRRVAAAGLGTAIIGDLTQPRGGPMTYGHASHETGLDVDVWLRLDLPPLPRAAREVLEEVKMVNDDTWRVSPAVWTDGQAELIRIAAEDPRVARIFVNPAIKLELCRRDWPDRAWLRVVRPWRGHDGHFHVRLHCPADSPACQPQAPPGPGDGCGAELMSWFPDPAQQVRPAVIRPPGPRPAPPLLPAACQAVLTMP